MKAGSFTDNLWWGILDGGVSILLSFQSFLSWIVNALINSLFD